MKTTYINSKTENKMDIKIKSLSTPISKSSDLKKYLEITIDQLFSEVATQENKDKVLTTKQKPYVLRRVLKQLKDEKMIEDRLVITVNLMIRNINNFITEMKKEQKDETGLSRNFIPSKSYKLILESLVMLVLEPSYQNIIKKILKVKEV